MAHVGIQLCGAVTVCSHCVCHGVSHTCQCPSSTSTPTDPVRQLCQPPFAGADKAPGVNDAGATECMQRGRRAVRTNVSRTHERFRLRLEGSSLRAFVQIGRHGEHTSRDYGGIDGITSRTAVHAAVEGEWCGRQERSCEVVLRGEIDARRRGTHPECQNELLVSIFQSV